MSDYSWTVYIALALLWWHTRTALRYLPFAGNQQFARYGAAAVTLIVALLVFRM